MLEGYRERGGSGGGVEVGAWDCKRCASIRGMGGRCGRLVGEDEGRPMNGEEE